MSRFDRIMDKAVAQLKKELDLTPKVLVVDGTAFMPCAVCGRPTPVKTEGETPFAVTCGRCKQGLGLEKEVRNG